MVGQQRPPWHGHAQLPAAQPPHPQPEPPPFLRATLGVTPVLMVAVLAGRDRRRPLAQRAERCPAGGCVAASCDCRRIRPALRRWHHAPHPPVGATARRPLPQHAIPRRGIARRRSPSGGGRGRRLRQGRPLERGKTACFRGISAVRDLRLDRSGTPVQFGASALGMSHRSPGRTTAQPCHPTGTELLGKQMATHHPAVRLLFVPCLSHDTLRPAPPQGPGAPS
jgi:hypothetical protein